MAQRKRTVLELAHPNAAGIDIGSASHFVAVSPDRDDEPIREFKSFTEDLEELADWGVKYSRAHPNAQPIALLSLCG